MEYTHMADANATEPTQIEVSTPDETNQAPADQAAPEAPATDTTPATGQANTDVKDVTVDGYSFKVDTNIIDDVDNLELINKIENGGYLYGIIEFLIKIIGQDGYDQLKAHFVEAEGKLSLTKLGKVYEAIFAQFDPKG